jgi:hypothetical protein
VIWIMIPLLALVVFGLYVRREAERIRAEDLRPRVIVKLKLAGEGMATPGEVRLRRTIEEAIETRGIGAIADTGSGEGWATIQVGVADPEAAIDQIGELLRERGLFDGAVVRNVEPSTTAL